MQVSDALYHVGRHSSAVIKGIKCALSCLGICDDFMAEPFHRFRAEKRAQVQRQVAELAAAMEKLAPALNHHLRPPVAVSHLATTAAPPPARITLR